MNTIDIKINKLKEILEKQSPRAIDFEMVGAVTIRFVLHKPKYRYLKTKQSIQFYDKLTEKRVIIDIITATDIEINEDINLYNIRLDNGQIIKFKMY